MSLLAKGINKRRRGVIAVFILICMVISNLTGLHASEVDQYDSTQWVDGYYDHNLQGDYEDEQEDSQEGGYTSGECGQVTQSEDYTYDEYEPIDPFGPVIIKPFPCDCTRFDKQQDAGISCDCTNPNAVYPLMNAHWSIDGENPTARTFPKNWVFICDTYLNNRPDHPSPRRVYVHWPIVPGFTVELIGKSNHVRMDPNEWLHPQFFPMGTGSYAHPERLSRNLDSHFYISAPGAPGHLPNYSWAHLVANVRTRATSVQLQTRDLHLNYESGQENVGLRTNAVAGAYANDIQNHFTHYAHIENRTFSAPGLNLISGVWIDGFPQSAAPLTLRIPALPNGERAFEFHFECPNTPGEWIQSYEFTTGVLGGRNEGYCYNIRHIFDSLPIRPKANLPAGVHQTDVRIYQFGWVWSGTQPTSGFPPDYRPQLTCVWLGAVPIPGSNQVLLNPNNGQFRVTFEVLACPDTPDGPDVDILKTTSAPTIQVGQTFNYIITVSNTGQDPALGVVVTDELPGGVSFVRSTSTRPGVNFTYDNGTLKSIVGTLEPSESVTFTITVRADTIGPAINEAVVSGDNFEDEEDDAPVIITPGDPTPQPDVNIVKTASAATVQVGQTFDYIITVFNDGEAPALGVVVTDILPDGVSFVSSTSTRPGVNFTCDNGTLRANVGTLEPGEEVTFTVTVRAETAGPAINEAVVSGDNFEDKEDDVLVNITPGDPILEPNVRIEKESDATEPVRMGDTVIYTITVTNDGLGIANNLVVTDELPEGLRFGNAQIVAPSPAPAGANVAFDILNRTLTVTFPTLAVGESVEIEVEVTVVRVTAGEITNTAYVTVDGEEVDDDSETINVLPPAEPESGLEIIKRAQGNVLAGANLLYTITVENTGDVVLKNVVVTDQLPETLLEPRNLIISPATAGTGSITGQTIEVIIPELRVGELVTITFIATVCDTLRSGETIVNDATATTDCGKEEEDNVTTTVNNDPGIEIIKRAPSRVAPGGDIPYTLTVINTGNTILRDVVVTDSLPDTLTNPRNLVINPASAGTGSFTGQNLRVDIPVLGIGETVVITFTATVAGNVATGTIIRNDANVSTGCGLEEDDATTTHVKRPPGPPELPRPPEPPEPPKPPGAPLTGDSVRMLIYIVLAQFAAGSSLLFSYMRRRRKC